MKRRVLFLSIILLSVFCWTLFQKGNTYVVTNFGVTVPDILSAVFNGSDILRSHEGRINILLLGIGGEEHEGGALTDTIIISSFSPTATPTAVLLSIPRDFWSPLLQDKLNSAYYYGEERKEGSGLAFAKTIIETETGVPLQYAMILDFSKFKEIIDAMGGISVTIPQSFTDEHYPVPGKETDECDGDPYFSCRFESVTFQKGEEHMDGERALQYVRSRHAEGDSGNDFSRGRRQQEILVAMKNKIVDKTVWSNPNALTHVFTVFRETVTTDMSLPEFIALGKSLMPKAAHMTIDQVTLETELQEAPIGMFGRFALIPIDTDEQFISAIRLKIWRP